MLQRKAHNRIDLPREELQHLYWEQNLSSEEIGRRFLEWIRQSVKRLSGIEGALQSSRLYYNGKKAEMLGAWIYYDVMLPSLPRKRQIWESWIIDAKLAAARS